eukprot:5453761-Prymnesium_polylepis.2
MPIDGGALRVSLGDAARGRWERRTPRDGERERHERDDRRDGAREQREGGTTADAGASATGSSLRVAPVLERPKVQRRSWSSSSARSVRLRSLVRTTIACTSCSLLSTTQWSQHKVPRNPLPRPRASSRPASRRKQASSDV